MIDFDLKWSYHIQNIKNKLTSLTTLFYKIRFLNKIVIRQVWHTYGTMKSILLYGKYNMLGVRRHK